MKNLKQATHTPTPWKVAEQQEAIEVMADDLSICTMSAGELAEERGDAAFIIRAVNSHEELLVAALDLIDCCTHSDMSDCMKIRINRMRFAIAKAKGKV